MKKILEKIDELIEVTLEKVATFKKKFKELEYWTSKNTTTSVQCDNIKKAKVIIKNSKIEQKLEVRK